MNEILKKAEACGKLTWTYKEIRSCDYCDKKHDYHVYPRTTRYHQKGEKNYNKPKYYQGIKFNEGFVSIQGYGDMCLECCKKHNVINRLIDYIIENDLPIEIMKNDYKVSKYLKDDIRICYSCNKEMQESEMKPKETLMGDGYFPSGCPHCGAESSAFGKSHKTTNKFVMIENPAARPEIEALRVFVKQFNQDKPNNEDQINIWQNKRKNYIFHVRENRWTNGYRDVISIDTKNGIYEVGYFYQNSINKLIEKIKAFGLIEGKINRW